VARTLLRAEWVGCSRRSVAAQEKAWVGESALPTKPAKDIAFGNVVAGK